MSHLQKEAELSICTFYMIQKMPLFSTFILNNSRTLSLTSKQSNVALFKNLEIGFQMTSTKGTPCLNVTEASIFELKHLFHALKKRNTLFPETADEKKVVPVGTKRFCFPTTN